MNRTGSGLNTGEWLMVEWPVTIVADRYRGVYSGGAWTAWPLEPSELPTEIFEDDLECRAWWVKHRSNAEIPVGVGATPDAALASLRAAARSNGSVDGR